jgi:drug/metabolite transporter (DMT)-like permease
VPLAFASVSYTIGQALRGRLARSRASTSPGWGARLGWTLLGAVLMTIVFLLPLLGAVAWLIALIVGIGAAAAQLLRGGTAPAPA